MATKRLKPESAASAEPLISIVERGTTTMMNNMDDITSWNKQCFDSCVSASTSYAKSCEELSKAWMTCYQTMSQQWMQCCKAMMTAKTVKDAVDTQSEFVRSATDTVMSETTKMAELATKLASEISEPMQSQWSNISTMMSKTSKAA